MANFGVPIQTNKLPIKGIVPEKSGTAPTDPVTGQLWTDTSVSPNMVKMWNGTSWIKIDGSDLPDGTITNAKVSASAGIALSKLATNPLARANHTGTQTASTISDFNTAVRANRLDQMAVPTAALDMNGQQITNAASPTNAGDLVTKQHLENYIDTRVNNQDWKASVRAATTGDVTLSGTQTIDGVELEADDRILVKAQEDPTENGIYIVASGAWSRSADADHNNEVTSGMTVPVEEGSVNGGTIWLLTTVNPVSLGTSELNFTQIGAAGATYSAGTGLALTGNEFSLSTPVSVSHGGTNATTATAARTNLGAAGIFRDSLPELTAGVAVEIEHGLGAATVNCTFRIVDSDEFIVLHYESVDTDTVSIRSDIAFDADDIEIMVVG